MPENRPESAIFTLNGRERLVFLHTGRKTPPRAARFAGSLLGRRSRLNRVVMPWQQWLWREQFRDDYKVNPAAL